MDGDGDEEEAVQEGSEEKGLLLRAEGEAREEEIARSSSGTGNSPRVVVAKRLEFSAWDRDDDAGYHPVKRVGEPDEPHVARGHPFVDRIAAREFSGNRHALLPRELEGGLVEHVDVESAARVHDSEPDPPTFQFVIEARSLSSNILELPVAEREALVPRHLRGDVAMNRTVEVLRIQIECQLLTAKEVAPPSMGIVQLSLSGRLQGRVDVPIVVDAFRQVSQEIGPELPHVLRVVDDEGDVLEMPESGRVYSRVTPEDQRVDPATGRTGHPGRGRTIVHRLGVKAATLRERGRSKVSRKLVRGPYHAGESGSRVKASLGDQGMDGTHGRSSGFHAKWDRSSSASRRALAGDLISNTKTSSVFRI